MATLKDTLILGKLTVVDKIVKSGGLPTSILTGDGSMASVGTRTDSTATTGNSGQIYLVQRNAAGQLVVDVPWSAGSGDVVATSVAAGGGIDVTAGTSSYTVSHKDTSSATSVDGSIVNKITIDGYGHVTALGTTTIDLGSYVQGSSLTSSEIVVGNGGTAIKTSGYYVQDSFYVGTVDNQVPTSGAIKTWVEDKGYTTNTGNVTGSGLSENCIIVGNGSSKIKSSSCQITSTIYDQDGGEDQGDQGVPNVHAVASYVLGKGYTTNAGTVTGSGLTDNQIIIGTGGVGVEASGKTISTSVGNDDTTIPTSKAVQTYVTGLGYTSNTGTVTGSGLTANTILLGNNNSAIKTSSKTISTSVGNDDTTIPTSKAVQTWVGNQGYGNVSGGSLSNDFIILGASNHGVKSSSHQIVTSVSGTNTSGGIPTVGAVISYVSNTLGSLDIQSGGDSEYSYDENTGTLTIVSGDLLDYDVAGTYTPTYSSNSLTVYEFTLTAGGRINNVTPKSFTINSGSGTDKYHTSGSWSGLTYTATANGGAGALSFTIPTGDSSSTVSKGNHNHDARYYTRTQCDSYYVTPEDVLSLLEDYYTKSEADETFVKKCLLAGTKITMANGEYKNIENIKPGDVIKSIDLDTNEFTEAIVLSCRKRDTQDCYNQLVFDDGKTLKINWTHDLYEVNKKTWIIEDCELNIDDQMLDENKNIITYIGKFEEMLPTQGIFCDFYEIIVSNNCYFADGILCAHNPILQRQWLHSAFNKKKEKIPNTVKEAINQYKDERNRETDLVENEQYMKESVQLFIRQRKKEKELRTLKEQLANTDYLSMKISEGLIVGEEANNILKQRQSWRNDYNYSEKELENVYNELFTLKEKYSKQGKDVFLSKYELRKKYFDYSHKKGNELFSDFLQLFSEVKSND